MHVYTYLYIQGQKIEGLDVCRVTDVLMVCQNYMKDKDVSCFLIILMLLLLRA